VLGKTEAEAFVATLHAAADVPYELEGEARRLASAGFLLRAIELAELDRRAHDPIAEVVASEAIVQHDFAVALDALGKLRTPTTRAHVLSVIMYESDDVMQRSPEIGKALELVMAVEPRLDDTGRSALVTVLAELRMPKQAAAVAARIHNAWARALAQAETATALAIVDPKAAIAMTRAALRLGQAIPGRNEGFMTLIEIAEVAFVRAGAQAEAEALSAPLPHPGPLDVAIGLRSKPAALAGWWSKLAPYDRAWLLATAVRGEPLLADPRWLAVACP
jgi:hypothetical protein